MSNNREFFCNHCGHETTFFLESDLLWYCDECGHVLDSIPSSDEDDGWFEDEWDMEEAGEILRCPTCNNRVSVDSLVDGYLCPVCFEDLSDTLEENGYEYDEHTDTFIKEKNMEDIT